MSAAAIPRPRRPIIRRRPEAIELPADALACRSCGVAVDMGRRPKPPIELVGIGDALAIEVTWCQVCTERRGLAGELLEANPRVERAVGNVALHRLDAALTALDAIGLKPDAMRRLASAYLPIRLLIDQMQEGGASAVWAASLSFPGDAKLCAPRRWGHLSPEQLGELRADYFRMARLRVERPEPIPSPDGGGCMICGVGAIMAKPSQSGRLWTAARIPTGIVGGSPSPRDARGHTCPACTAALAEHGVGMAAVEAALLAFVGVHRASTGRWRVKDLRAWCVERGSRAPGATPWEHLDLAPLRAELARVSEVKTGIVAYITDEGDVRLVGASA